MNQNQDPPPKRKFTVIQHTQENKTKTVLSRPKAKIEMGKKKKEGKENQVGSNYDQDLGSNDHSVTMNNIPPEIINKILGFLSTSDLFTCRLVNWQFNETCSFLLHYRPSTQLQFTFDTNSRRWYQDVLLPSPSPSKSKSKSKSNLNRRKTLCQFTKCWKKSRFFPFARFKLHDLNNRTSDLLNFINSCAHLFISLQLNVEKLDKNGGAILRDILLEKSPNLQELIIKLDMKGRYFTRESWTLFPNKNSSSSQNRPVLPKLKILHLDPYWGYGQTSGCVRDILDSAINLERIEFSDERETDKDFLHSMRSFGKIHLVKNIAVDFGFLLTGFYFGRELGLVKNLHKFPEPILPVQKLKLLTQTLENGVNPRAQLVEWESAESFINRFIEKTKNSDGSGSLKELEMNPLGHLPDLNWSGFNSVERLKVCTAESQLPIFPVNSPGLKIFPELKQLELIHNINSPTIFTSTNSIPVIPSVHILKLWAYKATAHLIKEMIVMCPNICSLTLEAVDNFPVIGRAIWEHMKNITTLNIKLKPDPQNFFPMVDSTFTGCSPEACTKFMEKMKNDEEFNVEDIQRENESILTLKHLMSLTIQLYISDVAYETRQNFVEENRLETNMVTDVSHQLAFKLMPHLQVQMVNSCFDIYP